MRTYDPYAPTPKLQRQFGGKTFNRVSYGLTQNDARALARKLKEQWSTTKTRVVFFTGGRDGENAGYVVYSRRD